MTTKTVVTKTEIESIAYLPGEKIFRMVSKHMNKKVHDREFHSGIAQLVEQHPDTMKVLGSSPSVTT